MEGKLGAGGRVREGTDVCGTDEPGQKGEQDDHRGLLGKRVERAFVHQAAQAGRRQYKPHEHISGEETCGGKGGVGLLSGLQFPMDTLIPPSSPLKGPLTSGWAPRSELGDFCWV